MGFVQAAGDHFELDGRRITLRGWALGSWMNLEHFMIGLPGTNSQILDAFRSVYGTDRAEELLDRLLESMVGPEDIRYLRSLSVNTVRIPFGYHHLLDDAAPGVMLEKGFRRLDRAVRLCAESGLRVILDLHSVPGAQNTDWHADNRTGQAQFWQYRVFQDQVVWLWEAAAERYAGNPWVVGYDVLNEPGFGLAKDAINGLYARLIQAIRRRDREHVLFLEGTDFGRDFSPLEPVSDPNVAYTVHFYPFVLEEDVLDPAMDQEHRADIFTAIFDRQLSAVHRLGGPVWCGETGYEIRDGQEAFYAKLLLNNIGLCEERGISWNLWTYKDARCMGIVVPKRDSLWMGLARDVATQWSHHGEEKRSMAATRDLLGCFGARDDDRLAYELDFRVRAVLHDAAVRHVLVPRLEKIPWEIMQGYPDSFRFRNCDRRETVVNDIAEFIRNKEGV